MFHYREDKNMYYISSNKIKWEFWAFIWIFCKNRYITSPLAPLLIGEGDLKKLEKKYPWFKYSFWFTKNKIFIISKKWIEKIIKFN